MRLSIVNALKGREFVIRGEHNMDELSCECVKILDHDEYVDELKDCKCQIAFVDGKPLMTFDEIKIKYIEFIKNDKIRQIREERNKLLKETDYLMQPDYPLTEEKRQEWKIYRQQLRDITKYKDMIFPIKPN